MKKIRENRSTKGRKAAAKGKVEEAAAASRPYTLIGGVILGLLMLVFLVVGRGGEESSPAPSGGPSSMEGMAAPVPTSAPAPAVSPGTPAEESADNPAVNLATMRTLSIRLSPVPAYPGTTVRAEAEGIHPAGDLLTFEYIWYRNDEVVSGAVQEELDTSGFGKGDLIAVAAIPFDGRERGEGKKSLPILLHNRPPSIDSFPSAGIKDGSFTYQAVARDPDDDQLAFALENAPPGMEIDAASGLIRWLVPPDIEGKQSVRIVVSDGMDQAFQSFDLQISRSIN